MKKLGEIQGITLVALVVTIIILLILAGITIVQLTGSGLLTKTQKAKEENEKQTATETMNLKITDIQILSYSENQELPSLQYLADKLCEDKDIEYVLKESKKQASLDKIDVSNVNSIFTKLKNYPYEFEINSSLQLASIDGMKVADKSDSPNSTLVGKPTITLGEVGTKKITVTADIGDSNKSDIVAYVFFNADTAEIIDIRKITENLEVSNLEKNTKYNVYMKILDKYGHFSEMSNTVSFKTKNLGTINITYARGCSYNTDPRDYGLEPDVTNYVKQYLFDGIKTKQGVYRWVLNTATSFIVYDI